MNKYARIFLIGLLPLILGLVGCAASNSAPVEKAAPPAAPTAAEQAIPTAVQPSEKQEEPATEAVQATAISPAPALGETVLEDPFVDNKNGWPVSKDENAEVAITDGKYIATILTQNNWSFFKPSQVVSDIDLTVETTFVDGTAENTGYGVLCHVQDNKNLYGFSIAPDGKYTVFKTIDNQPQTLVDWTSSDAIQKGKDAPNQMRVICAGNQLILMVNDKPLVDITDDSLSGGTFALQAGTGEIDKKPVSIAFSNLVVRKPAQGVASPQKSLLVDKFDDNQNKWDLYDEEGGSVAIENGQLIMRLRKAELFWTKTATEFNDVDLTFDGSVLEGAPESAAYGAICRFQENQNYYVFIVVGDGRYGLFKSVNGKVEEIVGLQNSEAIQVGNAANKVHIVCSGEDLQLYVNDQSLILVKDKTYDKGNFMLISQSFDQKGEPIAVAFDNLEIKQPAK